MAKLKLHKCPFTKWRNIRERRFCTWSQLTLDRGYQENYPLWTMGPATLANGYCFNLWTVDTPQGW